MRNIVLLFLLLLGSKGVVFGQGKSDTALWQKDAYEDSSQLLIASKIVAVDSVSAEEIIHRVKNWAGTQFVNASNVIVSETSDQIVLNYVTNVFYGWYVRVVISIKPGKARVQFYDDGNVFRPGGQGYPATQSRSFFVRSYFKQKGYVKNRGILWATNYNGIIVWKLEVYSTLNSLETAIKSNSVKKDDW
jgi:hypothetical protein